jgi:hypothetical protein
MLLEFDAFVAAMWAFKGSSFLDPSELGLLDLLPRRVMTDAVSEGTHLSRLSTARCSFSISWFTWRPHKLGLCLASKHAFEYNDARFPHQSMHLRVLCS